MLSSQLCTDSDFFFFKQKTAYEMRISDWSSDVCSSDLPCELLDPVFGDHSGIIAGAACNDADAPDLRQIERERGQGDLLLQRAEIGAKRLRDDHRLLENLLLHERSEEHTSELHSLMRTSYAVFCLKQKIKNLNH